MNVRELADKLQLVSATGEGGYGNEVTGCYIGDLLSLAMARVKEGTVWVTIQTNINIAAVASLGDAACVIIADGFEPDENTAKKAEVEGITIFSTEMSAYEIAKGLAESGI